MLFFLFHDLFTASAHVALHATSFASMLDHAIEFAGRGNRRRVSELKLIARRDHIGYQRPIGEVARSVDLINQAWSARDSESKGAIRLEGGRAQGNRCQRRWKRNFPQALAARIFYCVK